MNGLLTLGVKVSGFENKRDRQTQARSLWTVVALDHIHDADAIIDLARPVKPRLSSAACLDKAAIPPSEREMGEAGKIYVGGTDE